MGACEAPIWARCRALRGVPPGSAEGEPSGVDVHAGDADVLERHGEQEGSLGRDVTEQVRVFLAALEAEGSVVQHLLVLVAGLLHLQLVQLRPQAHQLLRQALICSLHLPLHGETGVRAGMGPAAGSAAHAAGMLEQRGWGLAEAQTHRGPFAHVALGSAEPTHTVPGSAQGLCWCHSPGPAQMPVGLYPHGCCCLRHPMQVTTAVTHQ